MERSIARALRPGVLFLALIVMAVVGASVVTVVQAGTPAVLPPERTIEPGIRPGAPDVTPRPPAQIERPEPPKPVPSGRPAPTVLVKKFRVTGNTVIPTQRLEALTHFVEGKELTLDELREVAARITDYYASRGYILARAYLPPQDVREGVIEIAVLEGYVGNIDVTGNERYSADVIRGALTRVKNAKVVSEPLLETAINDLNDYPGLNVRASLKPGEKRGYSDIVLSAQERLPVSVLFDVDNYGSRFTGIWRYGTELSVGNLSGLGDRLTFRGIKSEDDLNYGRISYLTPLWMGSSSNYGTKVGVSYVYSDNGVGEEFAALQSEGRLHEVSLDIFQPIFRTAGASLQLFGGFTYKDVTNFTLGNVSGQDDLRIFHLGFNGDYRDAFLGRTYYGVTWYEGVPWLGANKQDDPGASRADNPGHFSKFTLDLSRLQSLVYGGAYLTLRGVGQVSTQNLQEVEKLPIGGYYTVRGFPLAEQTGDHGYAVTAELVVPVPYLRDWVQVVGFIDHGGVFLVSPNKAIGEKDHFLTGAGGGLRINPPVPYLERGALQIRIDYGVRVTGVKPSSEKDGIKGGGPGVLYFSSSFRW